MHKTAIDYLLFTHLFFAKKKGISALEDLPCK